ncbi:TPA: N-6 DNA methylase [Pseudomonas aeruginosa]|uniref:site-specific DNA-methyltransferase (adenine-specific) n=2 Tax=Pseudomonadaceae TaxID=135621 RepID=A0A1G9C9V5_9PSED|nr:MULTISPECIES: N-6 DNA methylase [Pseudomonadaceae]EIU5250310.1 N-6 DNA methylase [Pseudomonas aeruginosa]MBG6347780.1 N-6 DNA methylase [Pseudomonas aeruginosa]MBG6545775.1 N-6 DNA methylase [Pseudomonas aeruginosa]MBH3501508.1 N-6 DNA methylase [Pseudomonas aeruginosa]MBH4419464.1 N-6 DNA methylase [Pseudomonas aeruginosa]
MTPPSKRSIKRHIQTLGLLAHRYNADAATLVGTILHLWCKIECPALPKSSLPYSEALASRQEIVTFVAVLSQLGFLDATYWLSSSYAMLTEEGYRKKLAMFFTPVSLTKGLLDDLADQGTDFGRLSFMDPACGGAAFLAPIALRMRAALVAEGLPPLRLLKHVEEHLYGTDLDKTLCELSKHFLCMALHAEIQETGYIPTFNVQNVNSLTELSTNLGKIDVVVCNPPYRKMRAEELEPLRATYSDVIEAQPNLYCLFITLCVRLLRNGGRAALVTPTSFLSGQYFSRLRQFLIRNTDIEHIGMISDRKGVFIDVEQETAMTILHRRAEEDRMQVRANVSVVSATGQYRSVGECLLPNAGAVWPIPRSTEDVILVKTISSFKFRLTDYGYRVRIGAYVWNRDKRPKFESLRDAQEAGAYTAIPLLWSRDIIAGGIVQPEVISTYNGEHRFVDIGNKKCLSVIKSPCVVMQRVTSNDQPRRLVAAAVSPSIFTTYGGFIGENHVVIVEQVTDKPALPPTKLAELLSTYAVDRYFRCISGATNVSVFELSQLSLPDPIVLKEALINGSTLDQAVNDSFQLISKS